MADFLANDSYRYTPCSSPPSSPVQWDDEMSLATDSENDERADNSWTLTSDPYSANAKATQSPLIHDQGVKRPDKPRTMLLTPTSSFNSHISVSSNSVDRAGNTASYLASRPTQDPVWEDAIDDVFTNGASVINLDNSAIRSIPRAVLTDLNYIISLPAESASEDRSIVTTSLESPSRSAIASVAARSRRVLSQSRSSNTLFSGSPVGKDNKKRERDLQLYLSNNMLTVLPTELITLRSLVLLSLRGNNLRELPSAIAQITSLRSLNIASNQLAYLPAELRTLSLQTLIVDPNPFLQPPPASDQTSSRTRILGPTTVRRRIPTLFELALRVALARPPTAPTLFSSTAATPLRPALPTPSPSHTSVFSDPFVSASPSHRSLPHPLLISSYYDIQSWLPTLPPNAAKYIRAALHGSEDARDAYMHCPCPTHYGEAFVNPVGERFEWVTSLAGCGLSGLVPLLWKGCQAGCLDFLDDEKVNVENERDNDDEFMRMFGMEIGHDAMQDQAAEQIVWDDSISLD